jgi:hypothetical protein
LLSWESTMWWGGIPGLFWFAFPLWLRLLNISSYICHLYFFWELSVQFVCPFNIGLDCSFGVLSFEYFIYSWY